MTRLAGFCALGVLWLALSGFDARREQRHIIEQDKQFSRSELTINQRDSVFFHNNDTVVHNVFSTSPGNRFNLRPQKPGTVAAVVFGATGRVIVRCAFHPDMQLVVNVQ